MVVRVVRGRNINGEDSDREKDEGRELRNEAEQKAKTLRDRPNVQHVQIDTGKTWREGVIRWFPRRGPVKIPPT